MIYTSRAFLGAYNKGRRARRAGEDRSCCPYGDKRGGNNGQVITYSRSFQNFWYRGYDDEAAGLIETVGAKTK